MNRSRLPGIRFVPVRFTPKASVYQGQSCGGVYLIVTERERLAAVDVGIEAARILHRLYPAEFKVEKMGETLAPSPDPSRPSRAGQTLAEIKKLWKADLRAFAARRERFRQYWTPLRRARARRMKTALSPCPSPRPSGERV